MVGKHGNVTYTYHGIVRKYYGNVIYNVYGRGMEILCLCYII